MKKIFSFRKLLSIIISMIMCISAFPVAAMAADEVIAEQEGDTESESNNVDNIKLFDEKGKDVSDGISIERLSKTTVSSSKYSYDLKIYDNGKEIGNSDGAYKFLRGLKLNGNNVYENVNIIVNDNSIDIYVNNKAEAEEYDLAITVSKSNKELFTKHFKLTVLESSEDAESYGIAVSSITINKNNADDVLGDKRVSYDVSENILHLNNVIIKNAPEKIALYTTKDLTLNLTGTNEINGAIGNDKKPTITLEGNGTLIHSEYTPIYADYIMKSGKLEINSTDAEETISMLGSLTVDGGNAEINAIQPVIIQGGIVFKSGSLRYIGSKDISAQLINTANDYWWRTSENGDWTKGGYSKPDGAIKYFEITDADPDIQEEKFEFTKQPSDLSDIAKGATAYVKFEINKPAEEVKLLKVGTTYNQEKYSITNAPADTELSIPVSNTEEFEGSYTGTYVIRAYIGDGFYQSREFTITWVEKQPAVEHTVTAYGLYGETMGITPGEKYTMDYAVGERVALQIGKRSGYKLKGLTLEGISESDISWYLKDSESKDRGIVFDMPDNNVTVTVNWKRNSSSGGGSSLSSVSSTKYAVTSSSVENGEVIIDKANAAKGSDVTITPKADEGYELGSIKVTDRKGNEIKLTDNGDGTYTFTMPESKVNIDVSFKKIESDNVIKMTIGSIEMSENGRIFYNDVAPIIVDNRTMVPIRVITELLGGTADWNEATKEVTLTIDGKVIRMTVGVVLEKYGVAPVIINDRTYVPIRFVADEFGAETDWDEATKTVTIYTANK
ncbi:MAG: hypothetical protein EGQ35_00720 [Clostridiales bacterium]|nr:hypothetical protein [Clostridiales bacterium]